MIVLYGAGTIGYLVARQMIRKGERPVAFADNDENKWHSQLEGIQIVSPVAARALWPHAEWVATVLMTPYREEILKDIEKMGVKTQSLYDFLPARHDLPSLEVFDELIRLCADDQSKDFLWDQYEFRTHGKSQMPPRDVKNVYFEDFYTRLDNEHYVDCGAFDGDMVREFKHRWENYAEITAFEPDYKNYKKLARYAIDDEDIRAFDYAIGDHCGLVNFCADGDQTSHIVEGSGKTEIRNLDSVPMHFPPTLIKMDIEGYEKEGLWGARNLIKEHSPVLAICAYHHGPDLWEIPLLIHALNPNYKLYFRRYLEACWELIWYAVPQERVK